MELETWNLKLILLLLLYPLPTFGQASVGQSDEALQALSQEARAAVQQIETALSHRTRHTRSGRVDRETGIHRAVYSAEPLASRASNPAAAARSYLRREHQRLGLSPSLEELQLDRVTKSPAGHHLVFQQMAGEVPVYQGIVKVNLDRSFQPVSAFNDIYAHVDPAASSVSSTPSISANQARQIVRDGVSNVGAQTAPPELLIYPSNPPRLAWKVTAWPGEASAEWVMLVDAHDGSFIYGFNAATRLHRGNQSDEGKKSPPPDAPTTGRSGLTRQTEGSGLVFDPDPLTTAGVTYGGPYVDDNDGDADALNNELFTAPLQNLIQRNGEYYLEGPYVHIVGRNPAYFPGSNRDSTNYTPPSEADPNDFTYTRGHPDFEAVNAYYHIDKSQRYLRGLDPDFTGRPAEPIHINPHGEEDDDNSFFYPSRHMISFGQGGVDDAEDADVIWHEYGHALLRSAAPGLLDGRFGIDESRSFHEGWADYWAGSYRRSLAATRTGISPSNYDWQELFPWDSGNGRIWNGRRISHDGTYPASMTYQNSYQDGLLWAATLMDVFTSLETSYGTIQARTVSDRLNLQSHYFVPTHPSSFTFRDAAEALLQADLLLYEGEHRSLLLDHLEARGFIDPSMYGPALSFDESTDLEHDEGELRFTVVATAREFSVQDVRVRYRRIGTTGPFNTAHLEQIDDSLYAGTVSPGNRPGLIEYYFDATDALGISQTLPSAGPNQPFITEIGNIGTSDLLAELHQTGAWRSVETDWRADSTGAGLSYLVIEPTDLADNADVSTYAVLRHQYRMGTEAAGNVKISTDGGESWELIRPHTQYPVPNVDISVLQGEAAFSRDAGDETIQSVFDLSEFAGQQIQLRLDFASTDAADENIFWHVSDFTLYEATFDTEFSVSRTLALHPNYPNPFSTRTTVHFTLPSAGPVTVELYDALGRQIRLIRRQTYEAGTHTVRINGSKLAAGIYFIRLTTAADHVTQPIRVVR